ncbi:MAG: 4'-phosphopantetheinyl transferase superfamily protein [Chitinophagaceae bacterium]|nr:4'-phosphopantetheinyl transferase superfamily protein [Chitinophagaceae bacterium]
MPVFFQHQINETTRVGIWKIEEPESYFQRNVPVHRDVTHPHKRLQHLAGRFLLQYLFPDFPYELITIADTRKPFIPDERYHFSISHCGDYAAAIVSSTNRVGIDIEIPVDKLERIRHKFLKPEEEQRFPALQSENHLIFLTQLWSAKEAVFKWYGLGKVDFREHMPLFPGTSPNHLKCEFALSNQAVDIETRDLSGIVLSFTT